MAHGKATGVKPTEAQDKEERKKDSTLQLKTESVHITLYKVLESAGTHLTAVVLNSYRHVQIPAHAAHALMFIYKQNS